MKLQLMTAVALAAVFSVAAPAVAEEADLQAECVSYAQEDGIPADEMEEYLAQCMEDRAATESESDKDEPSEDDSKE